MFALTGTGFGPAAVAGQSDRKLGQRRAAARRAAGAGPGGGGAISGRVSIPDQKSGTLIQPAGQTWRQFHQVTLRWIGAIAILGMLALLVLFYLMRGMVKIEAGRSGRTIVRFNAFERFVHWMTATCFIVLALTGLNITFGKALLLPLLGPEAFADLVAVGQVRAQLPELPLHHRRRADPADVDRQQHPEPRRHGMDQARRRHRRQRSSAGLRSTPARR